jgi:hypothetical protein
MTTKSQYKAIMQHEHTKLQIVQRRRLSAEALWKGCRTLSMVQMKYGHGFQCNTINEQIFMLQFEKYEFQ